MVIHPSLRNNPLAGLIETNLGQLNSIRLLDRSDINKVLDEQKLQMTLLPESVGQRARLGELLKADLLVLLRPGGQRAGDIEVAVSETSSGLRLRCALISPSEKPEMDAKAAAGVVVAGLAKYTAGVRHIVAVLPFTSTDFVHDCDYLKKPFSQTVEEVLISAPGVVAVELDEARAIANELALGQTEQTVKRSQPFFVRGEYTTARADSSYRAKFSLQLLQGDRVLQTEQGEGAAEEALTNVAGASHKLLTKMVRHQATRPDPAAEVRELTERADLLEQYCQPAEALRLIEAALLLKPKEPSLHDQALRLIAQLFQRDLMFSHSRVTLRSPDAEQDYLERAALGLYYRRIAAHHLEQWLLLSELRGPKGWQPVTNFLAARVIPFEVVNTNLVQNMLLTCKQEDARDREMLVVIIEAKAARKEIDNEYLHSLLFRIHARDTLSVEQKIRIVRAIQDAPAAEQSIIELISSHAYSWYRKDRDLPSFVSSRAYARLNMQFAADPAYEAVMKEWSKPETQQVIDQILQLPGKSAQLAARFIRSTRPLLPEAAKMARVSPAELSRTQEPDLPPVDEKEHEVRFARLELDTGDTGGVVLGWMPCQQGVDALWNASQVFLMKQKGVLRLVYDAKAAHFQKGYKAWRGDAAFDGRYLWLAAEYCENPYFLAVDTVSERVIKISEAEGLPPARHALCVAPVAPGKACLAAAFGPPDRPVTEYDRTWCAIVSIDAAGPISVEVLLKATKRLDASQFHVPELEEAAAPRGLFSIRNPAEPTDVRILMLRGTCNHPLLINPGKREISIVQENFVAHAGLGGTHYPVEQCASDGSRLLFVWTSYVAELGYPELIPKTRTEESLLFGGAARLPLAMSGSCLHCVSGGGWWVGSTWPPFRRLKGSVPKALYYGLIRNSNHYGLILLAGLDNENLWPYQVEIAPGLLQEIKTLAAAHAIEQDSIKVRREIIRQKIEEQRRLNELRAKQAFANSQPASPETRPASEPAR